MDGFKIKNKYNIKKLVLIIVLLLCLTGCEATYEISINSDKTVDENLTANQNEQFFKKYQYSSREEIISMLMSRHIDEINLNDYNYNFNDNGINISKKFGTVKEYANKSIMIKQFFKKLNYKKTGNIIRLSTEEFYTYNRDAIDRFAVEQASISVYIPFKVINSNADKVNNLEHLYTWRINENTLKKQIFIEFDETKNAINYTILYIIIISVIGLLLVLIITMFFITKNKKNNQI